jgi:transposase-like protein
MRAFPEEFRRDVVKVARNSKESRNKIAADFGVSPATLSNWIRQADIEDGGRDGVTKEQAEDLRRLRRRNRLLEQENEVLRRAAAYLSQANLKLGGSPK